MDELGRYVRALSPYLSTPWDSGSKTYFLPTTPTSSMPKQSHAGNLLEHAKWAALQIIKWYEHRHPLVEGLDGLQREGVFAALLHDLCKGSECGYRCMKGQCWYDAYSDLNYEQKGDAVHPEFCGDILMGRRPFYLGCPDVKTLKEMDGKNPTTKEKATAMSNWLKFSNAKQLNLQKMCAELQVDCRLMALAAYMHWEFGRLNIPKTCQDREQAFRLYLDRFADNCRKCNLKPTETLLRFCVLIGAADIAAGFPVQNICLPTAGPLELQICALGNSVLGTPFRVGQVYPGINPWVAYGMNVNAVKLRDDLIKRTTTTTTNPTSSCPAKMPLLSPVPISSAPPSPISAGGQRHARHGYFYPPFQRVDRKW